MEEARPALMVLVPADWDVVPAALTELRRCLGEEYGASLHLRMASRPLRPPMAMYVGYWPRDVQRFAQRDLRPRIAELWRRYWRGPARSRPSDRVGSMVTAGDMEMGMLGRLGGLQA